MRRLGRKSDDNCHGSRIGDSRDQGTKNRRPEYSRNSAMIRAEREGKQENYREHFIHIGPS